MDSPDPKHIRKQRKLLMDNRKFNVMSIIEIGNCFSASKINFIVIHFLNLCFLIKILFYIVSTFHV